MAKSKGAKRAGRDPGTAAKAVAGAATVVALDSAEGIEFVAARGRPSAYDAAIKQAADLPVGKLLQVTPPEGRTAEQAAASINQGLRRHGVRAKVKGNLAVRVSADRTKVYIVHSSKK